MVLSSLLLLPTPIEPHRLPISIRHSQRSRRAFQGERTISVHRNSDRHGHGAERGRTLGRRTSASRLCQRRDMLGWDHQRTELQRALVGLGSCAVVGMTSLLLLSTQVVFKTMQTVNDELKTNE